jgi:hypothetical protein
LFVTLAYRDEGNHKHTALGQNSSKQIMNNSSVVEVVIRAIIREQGRRAMRGGAGVAGNLVKARDNDCELPTLPV